MAQHGVPVGLIPEKVGERVPRSGRNRVTAQQRMQQLFSPVTRGR